MKNNINPTIKECQKMMWDWRGERDWQDLPLPEEFMLLSEEVGEVAKAIRPIVFKGTTKEKKEALAEELADVLNYLMVIASKENIDLGEAFLAKLAKNKQRVWSDVTAANKR